MAAIHPNLDAWYRAENTPNDASGAGVNASWVGTAAYAAGKFGRALSFNGSSFVNTSSTTIGNGLFAASDRRWTVALWSLHSVATTQTVMARSGATPGNRTFQWYYGSLLGQFVWTFILRGGTTSQFAGITTGAAWIHGAVTWDGTTCRLYANGVLVGNIPVGAAAEETGENITLGARTASSPAAYSQGRLDEVMVFNAALDVNDIKRVMMGMMPLRRY
jgi:hypothetical protein